MKKKMNNRNKMLRVATLFLCVFAVVSCGNQRSKARAHINDPANGYIQEIKTPVYTMKIQYQPPAYRADQEIMINKSDENRSELVKEYDQLQQFVVQYTMSSPDLYPGDLGNMEKFNLVGKDTIPCIDAHQVPYSPGSPYHEMLLLFPVTEKELGKEFTIEVKGFPEDISVHQIKYILN